ncbi:hypothetical protein E2C01_052895 [Portunus trituberculatus]|uniref:Uncharacterized protein n=1 Tax=Portunus trituberculatus TaxID=210409 RepID=A0A5B7GN30_PORTR|nr:hypothetical protein [Portunus trituberculatus]
MRLRWYWRLPQIQQQVTAMLLFLAQGRQCMVPLVLFVLFTGVGLATAIGLPCPAATTLSEICRSVIAIQLPCLAARLLSGILMVASAIRRPCLAASLLSPPVVLSAVQLPCLAASSPGAGSFGRQIMMANTTATTVMAGIDITIYNDHMNTATSPIFLTTATKRVLASRFRASHKMPRTNQDDNHH